jgi:hypothetical protein
MMFMLFRGLSLSSRSSRKVYHGIDRRQLGWYYYRKFGSNTTSTSSSSTSSFFGSLLKFTIRRVLGWSIIGGGLYLTVPGKYFSFDRG